jgi:hypothetical protein
MSWESWTAIGSLLSAAVIAVTVIYAARQARITADQLEQMRRATQFEATRTVFSEFVDPQFVDAYKFVFQDFRKLSESDAFRREFAQVGIVDEAVHKEIVVLRALERIGAYVRYGLVDPEMIYSSIYAPRILACHEILSEVIAVYRSIVGHPLFENFDFLYAGCRAWMEEHGRTVDLAAIRQRRLEYESRFPVSPPARSP